MKTDIRASYLSAAGNFQSSDATPVTIVRARVHGIYVTGTGTITLNDSVGGGGVTRLTLNVTSSFYMNFPEDGILFHKGIYFTPGGATAATIFYG